ncbi:MAG TPA: TolC family outer membrane protein [Devosia sp.]|nr:TolC family outer membrane protein [Devosia sp.]
MFFSPSLRLGAFVVALAGLSASAAQAESLKAALTAAYAHNPTITSALTAVKVASESIALRKAATLPTIGATAGISDSFSSLPTLGGIANSPSASVGLGYNQTLFDNHKTDAQVEQARALVEVATQQLRSTEASVLTSVVQAYMNVILNTQLVQLRTDTVTFYQSQVKAAQDRQNIGEGTKIDVAQAQASLASAVAAQKAAQASLQTAQASYLHWVGHKPLNLSSDYNFGTLIPVTVDRALALADSINPAILAAKASIRAAQAGTDAAIAAFGPSVGLSGSIGPTFTGSFGAPAGTGTGGTAALAGKVGLSLSLPIYAGGALGAAERSANLSEIKSSLDAQAAIDQVNEAVVTAWSTLQNASAQIESAKSAVDAGQLALQGVIQERDVGQKTTLDVLNQEATLTTSKEALISASANKIIAAFALIATTGKMSPHDLGLNTPTKSATAYTAEVEDTYEELHTIQPLPRPAWRR